MDGETPQLILSVGLSLGAVIAAVAFAWAQYKRGTIEALKETIDASAKLLDTYKIEIDQLKDTSLEQNKKLVALQGEVDNLKAKNGDLRHVIIEALHLFFESHPEQAVKIGKDMLQSE